VLARLVLALLLPWGLQRPSSSSILWLRLCAAGMRVMCALVALVQGTVGPNINLCVARLYSVAACSVLR
jgi:hypothetical protein